MTETPEQAATRRRWISLAEAVAVAGVVIAALSLYLSWQDQREQRAERAETTQQQSRVAAIVTLRANRRSNGERLDLADPNLPVDAVTVRFPTALNVTAKEALATPEIDRNWFDEPLLHVVKDTKHGRLPVLIESVYWAGDTKRSDLAIYDLVWTVDSGLFGRHLKLNGMILRERGGDQRRLDALWRQFAPRAKSEN